MATETLRPNAAGSETAITTQYPASGSHYDKVDEVVADGDSTIVHTAGAPYVRDLYNLPAHSEGSGVINSVTVKATARGISVNQASLLCSLRTQATTYDGSAQTVTTTYALYSEAWATNPNTSAAWTWDDIDALEVGASIRQASTDGWQTRVTQVYVEVDYTAGASLTVSDTIALSEALGKSVSGVMADTIALAESLAKSVAKEFSESITLTESLSKWWGYIMTMSDTIRLADSWSAGISKAFSDTIALAESLAKSVAKEFSESIAETDTLTKSVAKAVSDSVALTDVLTTLWGFWLTVSDTIKLTDCLVRWRWLDALRNLGRGRCPLPPVRTQTKIDDGLVG